MTHSTTPTPTGPQLLNTALDRLDLHRTALIVDARVVMLRHLLDALFAAAEAAGSPA